MKSYPSFKVFSILFGVLYTTSFILQSNSPTTWLYGIFRYYPAVSQWSIGRLPPDVAGPAILWYAWLAAAAIASAAVALVVPKKLADRIPVSAVWMVPTLVVVGILFYERRWFY